MDRKAAPRKNPGRAEKPLGRDERVSFYPTEHEGMLRELLRGARRIEEDNPPPCSIPPLVLHVADLIAGGFIGVAVQDATDKVQRAFRRLQRQETLTQEDVEALAREALVKAYNVSLPLDVEPEHMSIGPGFWSVSYNHAGRRYTAWTGPDLPRGADVATSWE